VRYKNWKMYYSVSQPGAAGWLLALTRPHFPLIQNVKRDPFEQYVDPGDAKSLTYFGGSLTAPSKAFIYDGLGTMPLGQQLWLMELESYVKYPPLQTPESFKLTQVLQEVKKSHNQAPSD
jgi:arylsulfatase